MMFRLCKRFCVLWIRFYVSMDCSHINGFVSEKSVENASRIPPMLCNCEHSRASELAPATLTPRSLTHFRTCLKSPAGCSQSGLRSARIFQIHECNLFTFFSRSIGNNEKPCSQDMSHGFLQPKPYLGPGRQATSGDDMTIPKCIPEHRRVSVLSSCLRKSMNLEVLRIPGKHPPVRLHAALAVC
jgi:hypothetical protein